MSLNGKIVNIITKHPKLVTFGIVVAATFIVGAAIGSIDHNVAFANLAGQTIKCPQGCP